MNFLKIIAPPLISYLIIALFINSFLSFNLNFGTLWINIKYYFIISLGMLLMMLLKDNLKFKITLFIFSFAYLLLTIIDSFDNLISNSLIMYISMLLLLSISFNLIERK